MGKVGGVAAKPFVKAAVRLTDAGFRRGAQGNGIWLGVGLLLTALRVIGRLGARKREVVFTQELLPGESLDIRHLLEDRKGRPVR